MISKVSLVLFMIQILKRFPETLWLAPAQVCECTVKFWRGALPWCTPSHQKEAPEEMKSSGALLFWDEEPWKKREFLLKRMPELEMKIFFVLWKFYQAQDLDQEIPNNTQSCLCFSPSSEVSCPFSKVSGKTSWETKVKQLSPLHPKHLFRHPDTVCPECRRYHRLAAQREKKQPVHRPVASTHLLDCKLSLQSHLLLN